MTRRHPRPTWRASRAAAALALVALAAGCSRGDHDAAPQARPARSAEAVALFTSLPLYWSEAADIGALLRSDAPPHWARSALEKQWRLRPLDVLEPARLRAERRLLMVQPRPLSPGENVALDDWVRDGGRLLLFADPALTGHSDFALGDRRRPQDAVLLSPILRRWGLELQYDEWQPLAQRNVSLADGASLPVRVAGRFAVRGGDPAVRCRLEHEGVLATCRIGRGVLLAIADAALFEPPANAAEGVGRQAALAALTGRTYGR